MKVLQISQIIVNASIATGIIAWSLTAAPLTAKASSFSNITGGESGGDPYVGQYSFNVTDNGSGTTLWKFSNASTGVSSFISQIYFDWNDPKYALSVNTPNSSNVGTVSFSTSFNGPANLPQGNLIDFTQDLAIGSTSQGSNKGGIDKGETLGFVFNSTQAASSLLAAIDNGSLRVGIHVQGFNCNLNPSSCTNGATSFSDAFISSKTVSPVAVPVPGFLLGIMAAGVLGGTRLLRHKPSVKSYSLLRL